MVIDRTMTTDVVGRFIGPLGQVGARSLSVVAASCQAPDSGINFVALVGVFIINVLFLFFFLYIYFLFGRGGGNVRAYVRVHKTCHVPLPCCARLGYNSTSPFLPESFFLCGPNSTFPACPDPGTPLLD